MLASLVYYTRSAFEASTHVEVVLAVELPLGIVKPHRAGAADCY
jgi:hypothetical protein